MWVSVQTRSRLPVEVFLSPTACFVLWGYSPCPFRNRAPLYFFLHLGAAQYNPTLAPASRVARALAIRLGRRQTLDTRSLRIDFVRKKVEKKKGKGGPGRDRARRAQSAQPGGEKDREA